MIGQSLGHYRIESQLGSGGMGVVYRAQDMKLGRTVAIKLVGARFARTASSLKRPHICTIHEVGEADGQGYIVMEYVARPGLSHWPFAES